MSFKKPGELFQKTTERHDKKDKKAAKESSGCVEEQRRSNQILTSSSSVCTLCTEFPCVYANVSVNHCIFPCITAKYEEMSRLLYDTIYCGQPA